MKIWLILLGVVTVLVIALRRVKRRQTPLDDELYSKRIAVDYVQSGVAWVRADGTFGSVNQSFAQVFDKEPRDFAGQEWYKVFSPKEHARIRESYSQMILLGMVTFEAPGIRADGSAAWLNVRLVAVHDSHTRLVGHHCLIEDKSHEHDLEEQVSALCHEGRAMPAGVSRLTASRQSAESTPVDAA
jgi:PAS domain S-box-containing protein